MSRNVTFKNERGVEYVVVTMTFEDVEFVVNGLQTSDPRDGATAEWWDVYRQMERRRIGWVDEGGQPVERVPVPASRVGDDSCRLKGLGIENNDEDCHWAQIDELLKDL